MEAFHNRRASQNAAAGKKKDELLDPEKLLARKNYLSPKETLYVLVNFGVLKITYPIHKLFVMGCLAAMFVGMGATAALTVSTGVPGIGDHNPGIPRLLYGGVFPIGLVLILVAGGELFTGNVMTLLPPFLMGRISGRQLLKNWIVVYFSNFFGSVMTAYFIGYLGGLLKHDPYHHELVHYVEHKIEYTFAEVFFRGIGCNFLVCLATYCSYASMDITGKILGAYLPAMAFATIGLEHSIANMYVVSFAMMRGADVTIGQYLGNSIIPATLGNIIGGGFFVGVVNWYIHTGGSLWWKASQNHMDHHMVLYDDRKVFDAEELKVASDAVNEEIAIELSSITPAQHKPTPVTVEEHQ